MSSTNSVVTYFAVVSGTGPSVPSAVLCRISDAAGERYQLFGPRLEWTHVNASDVEGRRTGITARTAGEIADRLRHEAAECSKRS